MTNLPEKTISELQSIYQKEFGIKLTRDATRAEARRLLLLFHQYFLFLQNTNNEKPETVEQKFYSQDHSML